MKTISANSTPNLEITASHEFASWLAKQNLSLACTTYQTNRLFFVSSQANGRLKIHERLFDKPMGLYAAGDRLYMITRYQLWHFDNLLESGEKYGECACLYVPRTAYTTGDLNAHEVVLDDAEKVIFVNTDFSCLATLSPDYNFVPLWQPPFISKLVPEDRCHLNGVAMVEGKPKYVTACSVTDKAAGWRNCRDHGGVVIDVESNEIVATGLSMPHSPRWYQEKLWLVNSGTGELGYLDGDRFVPITFCPGFVRGLAFWGDFALVGLSKLRSPNFTGLVLEKRLAAEGNTAQCGLMVINLTNGQVVHWLHIRQTIEELFDVVVLPNMRQPEALGLQGDDIQRLVRFPDSGGIIITKPTVKRSSIGATPPVAGLPQESPRQKEKLTSQIVQPSVSEKFGVQYRGLQNLTVEQSLAYNELTFPKIQTRWSRKQPKGQLRGIVAEVSGQPVGLVLAEIFSPQLNQTLEADLISLFVLPNYRHQGIGTGLIRSLEIGLRSLGCGQMRVNYKSSPITALALEPLLKQQHWQPPQVKFFLGKTTTEQVCQAPWLHKYPLPDRFSIFPWSELSDEDRKQIQSLDYPASLNPLGETQAEPLNSLGLRYDSQLVGWMVTHRVATDAIRYSTMFVEKRFQRLGRAISLLSQSILRQAESSVPYCLFAVADDNPAMLQFVLRHLQPYLTEVTDSRVCVKRLRS